MNVYYIENHSIIMENEVFLPHIKELITGPSGVPSQKHTLLVCDSPNS